ncbi:hypothetical protein [Phenylobacterium sp.]|uniref:hypothetical protein n=1 Tax=Phenylobacterium sp. TaxID=1871053 RepID=UPI002621631A|nr:hypothetical protein [Phenylobacterium sp.]
MARYSVRRASWLLWRWQVELDGRMPAGGLSLSRRGARWAARTYIRKTREQRLTAPERPQPAEARRAP